MYNCINVSSSTLPGPVTDIVLLICRSPSGLVGPWFASVEITTVHCWGNHAQDFIISWCWPITNCTQQLLWLLLRRDFLLLAKCQNTLSELWAVGQRVRCRFLVQCTFIIIFHQMYIDKNTRCVRSFLLVYLPISIWDMLSSEIQYAKYDLCAAWHVVHCEMIWADTDI